MVQVVSVMVQVVSVMVQVVSVMVQMSMTMMEPRSQQMPMMMMLNQPTLMTMMAPRNQRTRTMHRTSVRVAVTKKNRKRWDESPPL